MSYKEELPCPEKPEPFEPARCAEPVVEVKDGLIANPPEPPVYDFKKRPDRSLTSTGMIFGQQALCELCFPCTPIEGLTADGAAALVAFAMRIDALICCYPYELDPPSCKGTISRRVKFDTLEYGHPVTTGAVSKLGKECFDYLATNPNMGPELGAITNLHGINSMPYIDNDKMNLHGVEHMLQMLHHMRDTALWMARQVDPAVPVAP